MTPVQGVEVVAMPAPAPAPGGDLIARLLDAVQRVGFPVVAALLLGYGFYRVIEEQRQDLVIRIEGRLERIERLCDPKGGRP